MKKHNAAILNDEKKPTSFIGVFLDEKVTELDYVYRGTSSLPETKFSEGFVARGSNLDLSNHIFNWPSNSAYVSSSLSKSSAANYSIDKSKIGFVYQINPPTNGINVENHLYDVFTEGHIKKSLLNNCLADHEVSIPHQIEPSNIKGAWQVEKFTDLSGTEGYAISSEFIPNPEYRPSTAVRLAQGTKAIGHAVTALGAGFDGYNLYQAYDASKKAENFQGFFNEGARIIASWGAAITMGSAPAKACFAIGGSVAGPAGAVLGGFTCGAIGNAIGYIGASQMINRSLKKEGVVDTSKFHYQNENARVEAKWAETSEKMNAIISSPPNTSPPDFQVIKENTEFLKTMGIADSANQLKFTHETHHKLNAVLHEVKAYHREIKTIYQEGKNAQQANDKILRAKEETLNTYRGIKACFNVIGKVGEVTQNKALGEIGSIGATGVSIAFNVASLSGAIPGVNYTGWEKIFPYAGIAMGILSIASRLFGKSKKKDDPTLIALKQLSEQIEQLRKDLFKIYELLSEQIRSEFKLLGELNQKMNQLIKIMISDGFESISYQISDVQREIDRLNRLVTQGLSADYLKGIIESIDKVLLYVKVKGDRIREIESLNLNLVVWMTNPEIMKNTNGLWTLEAGTSDKNVFESSNLRNHDKFLETDPAHQLGYWVGISKQILPKVFDAIETNTMPNMALFNKTLEAYATSRLHMGVLAAKEMDPGNNSLNNIKNTVINAKNFFTILRREHVNLFKSLKNAYLVKYSELEAKMIAGSTNRIVSDTVPGFSTQNRKPVIATQPWPMVIKHAKGKGPDLSFTQALSELITGQSDSNKKFLINEFIEAAATVGAGRIEAIYDFADDPATQHASDKGKWNFRFWVLSRGVTYTIAIDYVINSERIRLADLTMTSARKICYDYSDNFKHQKGNLKVLTVRTQTCANNLNKISMNEHLISSWGNAIITSLTDRHRDVFADKDDKKSTLLKNTIAESITQRVMNQSNAYPKIRRLIVNSIKEHKPLLGDTPLDIESVKSLMIYYAGLLNSSRLNRLDELWGKEEALSNLHRYKDLKVLINSIEFNDESKPHSIEFDLDYAECLIEYIIAHEYAAVELLKQQEAESNLRRIQVRNELKIDQTLTLDPAIINVADLNDEHSLGSGSFGQVYHAQHRSTHEELAVKVFRSGLHPDKSARTEMEVATRLSRSAEASPFIIKILGVTKLPTLGTAIVMEYAKGGNLYDALHENEESLPWEHCIKISQEMAEGVKFLHAKGVIHRDLKPTNILLTEDYSVKISDYGLARVIGVSQSLASQSGSSTLNLIGTPAYRAPELSIHPGRLADEKSDVYALSLIMWEILTRRIPFDHTDGQLFTIMNYWTHYKSETGDNPAFTIKNPDEAESDVVKHTFTVLRDVSRDGLKMKPENRPSVAEVVERLKLT